MEQFEFVVSDPSKNDRGYSIPNEEIDWSMFEKNRILLWMHDMNKPIGTCTTPELKDGKWTTKISFDQTDELSKWSYGKVKSGTIKAVSLGASPPAKYELLDDGQIVARGVVAREISLTTIGGNGNAVRLYASSDINDYTLATDESINLALQQAVKNTNIDQIIAKEMDGKPIALSLGLDENADASSINAKILELKNDASYKKRYEDLQSEIQLSKKNEFLIQLNAKIEAKALDASLKDDYIALHAANPELAKKSLEKLSAPVNLNAHIQNSQVKSSDRIALIAEYDAAEKDGTIVQISENEPEKFSQLYEAKFGKKPE